jgi:outer membrane immunogenic protein
MKRLLLATTAALALAAPAFAADLPAAMPTKAPAYVPAWSWSGFYIGGNLGGAWARASDTETATFPGGTIVTGTSETLTGVIGGGQIGYNWQTGAFVFGLEADIDGSSQNTTNSVTLPGGGTLSATDRVNAFGTVRGKLGWAADRWMFYVTGGLSWQNLSSNVSFTTPGGLMSGIGSGSTTRAGYAVGAGVATALWSNWFGGVEYLYLDTGSFNSFTSPTLVGALGPFPAGTVFTDSTRVQNNVVRAFLNYKF